MIETLEKTINGSVYSVTQFPARRALRIQAKLVKMIGPACSAIFVAAQGNIDEADNVIPKALSLLFDNVDERTFDQFAVELLQSTRKSGVALTESTIDFEFAGKLNELFLVIRFVLEANFSDFFSEGGILKGLIQQEKSL